MKTGSSEPPHDGRGVQQHLKNAAACGLRTAHIARPSEHGPGEGELTPKVPVDYAASSLEDLAAKLGV